MLRFGVYRRCLEPQVSLPQASALGPMSRNIRLCSCLLPLKSCRKWPLGIYSPIIHQTHFASGGSRCRTRTYELRMPISGRQLQAPHRSCSHHSPHLTPISMDQPQFPGPRVLCQSRGLAQQVQRHRQPLHRRHLSKRHMVKLDISLVASSTTQQSQINM